MEHKMAKNTVRFFLVLLMVFNGYLAFSAVPIEWSELGNISAADARARLISAAESYLGTPYRYGGLDSKGIDCSGLIYVSFRDGLRVTVPRTAERLYTWTERIATEELQPGDLVFFVTDGSSVSHVGIFIGNGQFIHSASDGPKTGVMYSRLDESYWHRTYKGAGRALPKDGTYSGSTTTPSGGSSSNAGLSSGNAGTSSGNSTWGTGDGWSSSAQGLFIGAGLTGAFGTSKDAATFRGLGGQAKIGYKGMFNWPIQAAFEVRPIWDSYLENFRLAFTISVGNDYVQVFAGPAVVFGEPRSDLGYTNTKSPAFGWLGEVGVSLCMKPIEFKSGGLSFMLEVSWLPHIGSGGTIFSTDGMTGFASDFVSNMHFSIGLRYMWML